LLDDSLTARMKIFSQDARSLSCYAPSAGITLDANNSMERIT
jgi:hypothetical protein